MASCDGVTLEYWLTDSIYCDLDQSSFDKIVVLCEPYRQFIENAIEDFNEETQSWRDYRNVLWDYIDKSVEQQIEDILQNRVLD